MRRWCLGSIFFLTLGHRYLSYGSAFGILRSSAGCKTSSPPAYENHQVCVVAHRFGCKAALLYNARHPRLLLFRKLGVPHALTFFMPTDFKVYGPFEVAFGKNLSPFVNL